MFRYRWQHGYALENSTQPPLSSMCIIVANQFDKYNRPMQILSFFMANELLRCYNQRNHRPLHCSKQQYPRAYGLEENLHQSIQIAHVHNDNACWSESRAYQTDSNDAEYTAKSLYIDYNDGTDKEKIPYLLVEAFKSMILNNVYAAFAIENDVSYLPPRII